MFINKNEHMDETHEQELFIPINHFKTYSRIHLLCVCVFKCVCIWVLKAFFIWVSCFLTLLNLPVKNRGKLKKRKFLKLFQATNWMEFITFVARKFSSHFFNTREASARAICGNEKWWNKLFNSTRWKIFNLWLILRGKSRKS